MNADEYRQLALRMDSALKSESVGRETRRLAQGLMGLYRESGEAIDILKRMLFQGHELDKKRLVQELGDVAWYLAASADALGYRLDDIILMNIDRLRAQYPNGFDEKQSTCRKANDI